MTMKRLTALFGGLLFFFLMTSMYMMLERFSSGSWENDIIRNENQLVRDSIFRLEKGIKVMEDQVLHSESAVVHIKNDVKEFESGKKMLQGGKIDYSQRNEKNQGIKSLADNAIVVKNDNGDMCPMTNDPTQSKADINVMNLYHKLPFDNPDGGAWKQGWNVVVPSDAFDKEHLQVFVIPHSHNDPGWIKTFEQYYRDQTNHIISNVVQALDGNENRKFIWAEISYFSRWWQDATPKEKVKVKQQINNGQFEIVTGGWVMHDEANPHYYAMIDQLIEGHQWLEKNLGVKPTVGWAIDPFGYSSTMPYLLKRMGFDAMVIQRVHYALKKHLAREKQLEFRWRQNWDQHGKTDILCHAMPFYSYDVPHTCGPDPKVCCQFDFRRLPGGGHFCPWHIAPVPVMEHNIKERSEVLLDQYRKKAQLYGTNVLLVPLGDDFRYEVEFETREQFTNYEKIMNHINGRDDLKATVKFGTLSDYFAALKRSKPEAEFPSLSGDFMTYADRDDHYWSGYYTSRSFQKHMDRVVEDHLRAAEILYSLGLAYSRKSGVSVNKFPSLPLYRELVEARQNLGLFQHHDGITGTAKDHVVVDYGNRMLSAINSADKIMAVSSFYLLTKEKSSFHRNWNSTTGNVFVPLETRGSHDSNPRKRLIIVSPAPQVITVYNSLGQSRRQTVHVEVSEASIIVKDSAGVMLASQVTPIFSNDQLPSNQKYQLSFQVSLGPLEVGSFSIERQKQPSTTAKTEIFFFNGQTTLPQNTDQFSYFKEDKPQINLSNDFVDAIFSSSNGMLTTFTDKKTKSTTNVNVEFMTYGTTSNSDKSGAYLFMPDGEARSMNSAIVPILVIKGPIYSEVRAYLPMITHIVRLFNDKTGFESGALDITNIVDIRDTYNKELVMRMTTNIQNPDNEFFTDLNGFQLQKRKTFRQKLPLQANFYPMPSTAMLQDSSKRLTLHSAQSGGAASLRPGQLEVVQDRRLFQDDNRGLGQGVTDNKVTFLNYKLLIEDFEQTPQSKDAGNMAEFNSLRSLVLQHTLQQSLFVFIAVGVDAHQLFLRFPGLAEPLPCDTHLLNLKTLTKSIKGDPDTRYAMLLHRQGYNCNFKVQCPSSMSFPNPDQLFNPLHVSHVEKMSLSMMHSHGYVHPEKPIEIDPMEINTYKIGLS